MEKIQTFSLSDRSRLLAWFAQEQRLLPWRENRDPYRIWLSETMLQQTTTTAVIPYFHRFLEKFPTLVDLANADVAVVLEAWAGLGYYSRARNLHRAAQALNAKGGFPKTFSELIEFPGFGPYTARAVSSLAFGESVGVLDGNVIRVLSRYYGWAAEWWRPKIRNQLQDTVDRWVQDEPSPLINQAFMELGAMVCQPQSPRCALCPLRTGCQALKTHRQPQLPLKKPKRTREIWLLQLNLKIKNKKIALIDDPSWPFLKGHWVPPGQAVRLKKKPKSFHFRHTITHHDIFVSVIRNQPHKGKLRWIQLDQVQRFAPASLIQKALDNYEKK